MKQIKFRYWDGENMQYDVYLSCHGITDATGNTLSHENRNISQYIGIQDINGKDIYEGDRVRALFEFEELGGSTEHIVEVVNLAWGDSWFQWDEYSDHNVDWGTIEVVGNIWEM